MFFVKILLHLKQHCADGEKESLGCGAYNLNFLDEVIFTIDRKGYYENKYDYDKIYEQLGL